MEWHLTHITNLSVSKTWRFSKNKWMSTLMLFRNKRMQPNQVFSNWKTDLPSRRRNSMRFTMFRIRTGLPTTKYQAFSTVRTQMSLWWPNRKNNFICTVLIPYPNSSMISNQDFSSNMLYVSGTSSKIEEMKFYPSTERGSNLIWAISRMTGFGESCKESIVQRLGLRLLLEMMLNLEVLLIHRSNNSMMLNSERSSLSNRSCMLVL